MQCPPLSLACQTHTGRGAGTKLQEKVKKLTQDLEVKMALYKVYKRERRKCRTSIKY